MSTFRLKKKFLFFPIKLGNDKRWMKTVHIVQKYVSDYSNYDDYEFRKWKTCRDYGFIKQEDYAKVVKSIRNNFPNCLRIFNKEE